MYKFKGLGRNEGMLLASMAVTPASHYPSVILRLVSIDLWRVKKLFQFVNRLNVFTNSFIGFLQKSSTCCILIGACVGLVNKSISTSK